jgi:HTH-type transcriptional regulator / antitoxin HipB
MIRSVQDLGAALRVARKALGLTQADLALAAGVGLRFVVELEAGKPTVRLELVLRVINALGGTLQHGEKRQGEETHGASGLEQQGAIPLSQNLPVRGLLPEGQLRQRIAQQCQISQSNDFGLLAAIGGDCAGAVSLRVGDQPAEAAAVEWLEPDQLIALLDELPQRPMLAQRDGGGGERDQ